MAGYWDEEERRDTKGQWIEEERINLKIWFRELGLKRKAMLGKTNGLRRSYIFKTSGFGSLD